MRLRIAFAVMACAAALAMGAVATAGPASAAVSGGYGPHGRPSPFRPAHPRRGDAGLRGPGRRDRAGAAHALLRVSAACAAGW